MLFPYCILGISVVYGNFWLQVMDFSELNTEQRVVVEMVWRNLRGEMDLIIRILREVGQ